MLWGVVATVLNFVPYLGGIVATLIIATVSLLTFITWPKILMPPLFYILLNGVEGQFVTPMIVGRQLALNPIAVVLSLLFWGWVWGIGGMLIAVPILAAIQIVSQNIASLRNVKAIVG
jgi:predicted PurR-regulated permease PerM